MTQVLRKMIGIAGLAMMVGAAGCGGDDEPPQKRTKRSSGGRAKVSKKAQPGKKGARGGLQFYVKVEDVARAKCTGAEEVCAKEAKAIRHRFTTRDFEQDLTGSENRDPFRSYVLRDPNAQRSGDGNTGVKASETCKKERMRAPNPLAKDAAARKSSALRDLRLKGIVLQGTKSYAVFTDRSSYGHIVRIGDCLGKEKAYVAKIGAGFVELEIVQESTDGPRPVQKREIALHPEELQLDTLDDE